MDPLGILADDLTGACDCAAPFAARGARVVVCLEPAGAAPRSSAWDVLVVNTDSRHQPVAEARARVRRGALLLRQGGWPLGFKKIDSTLRGHIGAEIEELLELGVTRAWLAPAFPQQGRTVEAGRLLVHGAPLAQTAPEGDATQGEGAPPAEGRIAGALGPACEPVGQVELALLKQGAAALAGQVRLQRALGCRVIVCDGTEPAHLRLLARMLREREIAEPRELFVGSAGLTRELAEVLLPEPSGELPPSAPAAWAGKGPVLVFAGSRQSATGQQVTALAQAPGSVRYTLDPARLDTDAAAHQAEMEGQLRGATNKGARALVVDVRQDAGGAPPDAAVRPERQSPVNMHASPERARRILDALAALAGRLVPVVMPRGLVLTGGDVALAVLQALHAATLVVEGELLPGIARARIGDGPLAGLPLVTKAGGFGDAQTLLAAAQALGAEQH